MPKKQIKRHWNLCPNCYQLVFVTGDGVGQHVCPESIRAERDAQLDWMISEELSTWDADVEEFWNSSDVKFMKYILDQRKE